MILAALLVDAYSGFSILQCRCSSLGDLTDTETGLIEAHWNAGAVTLTRWKPHALTTTKTYDAKLPHEVYSSTALLPDIFHRTHTYPMDRKLPRDHPLN